MAVSHVAGLTPGVYTICNVIVAISVALMGYHAQDRSQKPPAPPSGTIAVILCALLIWCAGCRTGGFSLGVRSPTFGSVALSVEGVAIGKGHCPTNAAPAVLWPP
jgi:hypothetical protein